MGGGGNTAKTFRVGKKHAIIYSLPGARLVSYVPTYADTVVESKELATHRALEVCYTDDWSLQEHPALAPTPVLLCLPANTPPDPDVFSQKE